MEKASIVFEVARESGGLFENCQYLTRNGREICHLKRCQVIMFKLASPKKIGVALPLSLELHPIPVNETIAKTFSDMFIRCKDEDTYEVEIVYDKKT